MVPVGKALTRCALHTVGACGGCVHACMRVGVRACMHACVYVRVGASGLMPQRAHTTNLNVTPLSRISTFLCDTNERTHSHARTRWCSSMQLPNV